MWKIILLIFLLLILGGMFVYQYLGTESADNTQNLPAEENVIYVSGQRPGPLVSVDRVLMPRAGYVVIYSNNNGNQGEIIGNSRILSEGESINILVSLVRPMVAGESLFAMLHEDNGDGTFSPNIDVLMRDEDGNIMYMIFVVDQNASRP